MPSPLALALALQGLPAADSGHCAHKTRLDDRNLWSCAKCGKARPRARGRAARRGPGTGLFLAHHREGDGTTPTGHVRDRAGRSTASIRIPASQGRYHRLVLAGGLVGTKMHARGRTTRFRHVGCGTAPTLRRWGARRYWRITPGLPAVRGDPVQRRAGHPRPRLGDFSCTSTPARATNGLRLAATRRTSEPPGEIGAREPTISIQKRIISPCVYSSQG